MNVLLTGATGFIGRPLAAALAAAGHDVVGAVRDPAAAQAAHPGGRYVRADYTRDMSAEDWRPRLAGIDVAVNAVGILQERGAQTFEALHERAPRALFEACAQAGVRVVQISALGADAAAASAYHRSKRAADEFLLRRWPHAVVAQPALVYGADGASARLFTRLASLPLVPLPGAGAQRVQPIHREDLVAALVALVESPGFDGRRVVLAGPAPLTLRELLDTLRRGLGLSRARFVPVPMPVMRLAATAAAVLPGVMLDRQTLAMLERGNTGDPAPATTLLGRAPRPPAQFIAPPESAALRQRAKLAWLLPLLRLSLAAAWLLAGIVSLGLYPVSESYALLARAGIGGSLAPTLLYGAAALNLVLGLATLLWPRRALWAVQIGVIAFYTAVITWKLPEFWLHPYGPIVKNLPMLAALLLLYELDD